MKVDLHCHTKKIKTGDPVSRSVTSETFKEKILAANVELVAITNHNAFDIKQYHEFSNLKICKVWPGIELDVASNSSSKGFHIIVVCDPCKVNEFNTVVEKLTSGKDPNSFCLEISELVNTFNPLKAIFISHYADKSKAITAQDRTILEKDVPSERLFLEPRNLRTLGVRAFSGDNAIIGSDVQNWSTYESCTFAELRLEIASFEQLILLAKRDNNVIQHLLDQKSPENITVSPASGIEFPIQFYNDINIIFGEKGTGKSQILESINKQLLSKGQKPQYYKGSEREKNLSSLLEKTDMEQSASILTADDCSSDFKTINFWEEPDITLLKAYRDWYETSGFDAAKIKMKLATMRSIGVPNENPLKSTIKELEGSNKILKLVSEISLENYLSASDIQELERILTSLRNKINLSAKNSLIDITSQKLTNFTIQTIKKLVAGNKGSLPIPISTGFEEYASARIKLAEAVDAIRTNLEAAPLIEREFLGPLEEKGNVYIDSTWSFWSSNSNSKDYPRTGRKVSDATKAFFELNENCLNANYQIFLKNLIEAIEDLDAKNLNCFVGTNRKIALENKTEYNPSNGEKSILLLRRVLDTDASVYLIDEPELGMGNSFIESSIRPKLLELSKLHRIVIIATHNANIAVRTLPYCTVYREHTGSNNYKTYVGNPFSDALVDIDDPTNEKNWTETSLNTLEGGRMAFGERGSIYEAAENQGTPRKNG